MKLPNCDKCGCEQDRPGALVFSPPYNDSTVTKFHVCGSCWDDLMVWMTTAPEDNARWIGAWKGESLVCNEVAENAIKELLDTVNEEEKSDLEVLLYEAEQEGLGAPAGEEQTQEEQQVSQPTH